MVRREGYITMSNYTKTTDFAAKDSLASGNPAKIVKGTEIDAELAAIAVAIASKQDSSGATFASVTLSGTNILTGTLGGSGSIDGGTF